MKRLSTLNCNPIQNISYVTNSGKNIDMTFRYLPTQSQWVLDVDYETGFSVKGVVVSCYPNILDKYHNLIDFGINISTDDGLDPFELTCFQDGSCFVCILDENEKNQAMEYLDGV